MGLIHEVFSCDPTAQEMLAIAERLYAAAGEPKEHAGVMVELAAAVDRNWDGIARCHLVAMAHDLGMEEAAVEELRSLSDQRAALTTGAIPHRD